MEKRVSINTATLERKLVEAAAAHHQFELVLGIPDPNWPAWYARFIVESMPFNSSIQPGPISIIDEVKA